MEIFAFLNLSKGRVAFVALLALLGGVAGGLLMRTQLASYTTTVDVRVNEIFAPGRPAYDSSSYAPSFVATVGEAETARQIAEITRVSADTIGSGLEATLPTETGLPVEVTYTASTEAESKHVAEAAAQVSLRRTAELNRLRMVDRQKAARATYDLAAGAFNEFTVRSGFGDNLPDAIASLEGTELPRLKEAGSTADVAAAQARLDRMKAALPEYSPLAQARASADSQLAEAAQAVTNANDTAALAAAPGAFVATQDTVFDSGTSKLVRGAVGGVIVGAFLALALGVLKDSRRTVRVNYPGSGGPLDPAAGRAVASAVEAAVAASRERNEPADLKGPVSDDVLVRLAKSGRVEAKPPRGRASSRRR